MKNLAQKSKLALAFASGALCVGFLQVSSLQASTTSLSGTCVGVSNYSVWGWPNSDGDTKEYSELNMVNFDTNTAYAMVNAVAASTSGSPTYTEGNVETSSFTVDAGPMSGTYKLIFDGGSYYLLAAPANDGNTIFIVDSSNGATGVCQRL